MYKCLKSYNQGGSSIHLTDTCFERKKQFLDCGFRVINKAKTEATQNCETQAQHNKMFTNVQVSAAFRIVTCIHTWFCRISQQHSPLWFSCPCVEPLLWMKRELDIAVGWTGGQREIVQWSSDEFFIFKHAIHRPQNRHLKVKPQCETAPQTDKPLQVLSHIL